MIDLQADEHEPSLPLSAPWSHSSEPLTMLSIWAAAILLPTSMWPPHSPRTPVPWWMWPRATCPKIGRRIAQPQIRPGPRAQPASQAAVVVWPARRLPHRARRSCCSWLRSLPLRDHAGGREPPTGPNHLAGTGSATSPSEYALVAALSMASITFG
jgi:hypothetical protein